MHSVRTPTVFDSYKYFTVTVEARKHSELKPGGREEPHHQAELSQPRFYDVKVDPNGVVVGFVRTIRDSHEAGEIAKEYAGNTFGFKDFKPLTTAFDGTYYTVTVWREDKDRRIKRSSLMQGIVEGDLAAGKKSSDKLPREAPSAGQTSGESVKEELGGASSKELGPTPNKDAEPHYREVHGLIYCDVKVDKNGFVVSLVRTVRTADEAEAIAKEYDLET